MPHQMVPRKGEKQKKMFRRNVKPKQCAQRKLIMRKRVEGKSHSYKKNHYSDIFD